MTARLSRFGYVFFASAALVVAGCKNRLRLSAGDASVVVAAPTAPAGEGELKEVEPNGVSDAPMPVGFSPAGTLTIDGTLAPGDEVDKFLVLVPGVTTATPPVADAAPQPPVLPTKALALELTPPAAFAVALTAEAVDGRLLGRAVSAAGVAQGLPNLAVVPGQQVLVTLRRMAKKGAPGEPGAYRLTARIGEKSAADETEPNDNAISATATGPAHTTPELAGFIGGAEDRDWFRTPIGEISESSVIVVELEPPDDVAAILTV